MPHTQLPPPSPLRTGIIPSPGSSNASTPTPGPNQSIPPGLASPSFLNQQPTSRIQSPFVPAQQQQSSHRVSLSASSTSSNGSSSYLSASASANQPSSAHPSSASNGSSADRSPPSPSFRTVQAANPGLVSGAAPGAMLGPSPGVKVPGASAVRTPGGSFLSSAEESVWAPPGSATRVRTPLGGWGAVEELGPFGSGTPVQQLPPQPILHQQPQQQFQTPLGQGGEDDELDKLLKKSPLVNVRPWTPFRLAHP
jgi:hypothetical protein